MSNFAISLLSDVALYLGLALGLWLSFRVLAYPDLALEQLFVLGSVLYAVCVSNNLGLLTLLLIFLISASLIGFVCSAIRNKFRVHPVIISLAAGYAYYSLSLVLLDGPNRYVGEIVEPPTMLVAGGAALAVFGVAVLLLWGVSRTRIGLKVIAAGSNWELARRHRLSPTVWQGFGLAASFLLIMASGALYAWRAGNADVSYGSGLLLVAIFVVVVTRAVQSRIRMIPNSLTLALFLFVYLGLLQAALSMGMPSQWLRGLNAAALLGVVLALPKIRGRGLTI